MSSLAPLFITLSVYVFLGNENVRGFMLKYIKSITCILKAVTSRSACQNSCFIIIKILSMA